MQFSPFIRTSLEEGETILTTKDDYETNHMNNADRNEIEMQEYPLSVIAFAQGAAIHNNLKPINRKKFDIDVGIMFVL